jgi:peptide chain release factor 1
MKINKKDCKIETMRGTGPGGQHRNKTDSAVRITHLPTGISAYCDERSQKTSLKKAWEQLELRLIEANELAKAKLKKEKRDLAIYNFSLRCYFSSTLL